MVKSMGATSENDTAKHVRTLVNGRCEHAPKSGKQLLFLDFHSLWFVCFFKNKTCILHHLAVGVGRKGCLPGVKRGVACAISRYNVVGFVLYRMSI